MRTLAAGTVVVFLTLGVPLDAQPHPEMVGREALLCADDMLDFLTDQPHQARPAPVSTRG